MTRAYYNEFDPFAAEWLRNLIHAGLIASGDVDERSIEDVTPNDLLGYTQCHFFAGIGVWSYALRRAGWVDDRPVWTASCPCQPFSSAGASAGFNDERHLWPSVEHLARVIRPAVIFGEQVASTAAGPWVDLVHADLEAMGYAFGCVPFPSAGVGAPHIRDRLYWVADSPSVGCGEERQNPSGFIGGDRSQGICARPVDGSGDHGVGAVNGFWGSADWLHCRDGKWRAVEPGTFPLANGATSRVGRLRAYGNAINAEAAVAFIQAATPDLWRP